MANKKIGLGGLGESLMTENAEGINALLDIMDNAFSDPKGHREQMKGTYLTV